MNASYSSLVFTATDYKRCVIVSRYPLYQEILGRILTSIDPQIVIDRTSALPDRFPHNDKTIFVVMGEFKLLDDWSRECFRHLSGAKLVVFSQCLTRNLRTLQRLHDVLVLPQSIEVQYAKNFLRNYILSEYQGKASEKVVNDLNIMAMFRPNMIDLTEREHQIMQQINLGNSNSEIAQKLAIHINTVKVHVAKICRKSGVRNRTAAASNYLRIQSGI
ncbi:MAG: LuxR C-terminal-related transcriptional regulator [Neptuniibacter sp.]